MAHICVLCQSLGNLKRMDMAEACWQDGRHPPQWAGAQMASCQKKIRELCAGG